MALIQYNCSAQTWTQISDFPGTERDDATLFRIGDIVYIGNGAAPWFAGLNDFATFDLNTYTWSAIAAMPIGQERQYANGFSHNGKGYVFAGYSNGNFLNDLWEYDPITNVWTQKNDFPSFGRSGSSHFTIGDTTYIIGGKSSSEYAISEVWAYAANSDTWIQKNDLPFGTHWRGSGTAKEDIGFLLFGIDNDTSFTKNLYTYNNLIDEWNLLSTFPDEPRAYSFLEFRNHQLFTGFGLDTNLVPLNDFWSYSLTDNTWSQLTDLPALERRGGVCFSSYDALFYTTGLDLTNTRIKETWRYSLILDLANTSNQSLTIYPNPAKDYVSILSDFPVDELTIYSSDGKYIQQSQYVEKLDLTFLNSGIYFFKIKAGEQELIKLVVLD